MKDKILNRLSQLSGELEQCLNDKRRLDRRTIELTAAIIELKELLDSTKLDEQQAVEPQDSEGSDKPLSE